MNSCLPGRWSDHKKASQRVSGVCYQARFPRLTLIGISLGILLAFSHATADAGLILPSPGGTLDGIGYSVQYDDFESYSSDLLDQLQNNGFIPLSWGNYQPQTGTGNLDLILYTGSLGADNQNIGPGNAFNFEDPAINPSGSATSFQGLWGEGVQANGPVTVGNIRDYLDAIDPGATTPAFFFDLNQTGANEQLDIVARVFIFDPVTSSVVKTWALDTSFQPGDGTFDVDAPLTTAPKINSIAGDTNTYSLDPNKGSGKADFITIAPTMDLSLFDSSHYFVTEFYFGDYTGHPDPTNANVLNNGFEELFLGAARFESQVQPVPEPASVLGFGIGFSCLSLLRVSQRRLRKQASRRDGTS